MDKHSGCDCILSTTIIIFDRLRSTAKELAVLLFFQEYVLMMPRAISAKSTNVKANTIGRISRRNLANVTILINAIQKEGKSIRSYSKRICNSLFTAIFFLLARETDHLHASSINPIQKEIDFMAQNIKNKITLSDICAISGRSVCTLSRAFKEATGRSPIDYLISMRIAKAKCLLNKAGITMEKVALETGFCNASHLSTTLRTHASPCHRLQSHDRFLK